MAGRIPSSIFWLINKRARLAGEIAKTEKALSKVQHLVDRLKKLEASLQAIDDALSMPVVQRNGNDFCFPWPVVPIAPDAVHGRDISTCNPYSSPRRSCCDNMSHS